ncbi:MAG: DUF2158 domain-containing protein [Mucilaginibacter polytrichastri]|nr:DUF2158 domain-containing protein [Mucilaginibacter polytrichastri]
METTFQTGDIVKLAIDGPRMVVTEVLPDGLVKCFWFNKHHQPHTETFSGALLIAATGENKSAGFFSS